MLWATVSVRMAPCGPLEPLSKTCANIPDFGDVNFCMAKESAKIGDARRHSHLIGTYTCTNVGPTSQKCYFYVFCLLHVTNAFFVNFSPKGRGSECYGVPRGWAGGRPGRGVRRENQRETNLKT